MIEGIPENGIDLRGLRENLGLKQVEWCALLGLSRRVLQRYENGEHEVPVSVLVHAAWAAEDLVRARRVLNQIQDHRSEHSHTSKTSATLVPDIATSLVNECVLAATRLTKGASNLSKFSEADFQNALFIELDAKGYVVVKEREFETSMGPHQYDLFIHDPVRIALELKLTKKSHPADNARLNFWYDIEWLELAQQAGNIDYGICLLLTDKQALIEETGRGRIDDRENHYRIGRKNPHRCNEMAPDHFFDLSFRGMSLVPGLFPLRISGCYDFRDCWYTINDNNIWLCGVVVNSAKNP